MRCLSECLANMYWKFRRLNTDWFIRKFTWRDHLCRCPRILTQWGIVSEYKIWHQWDCQGSKFHADDAVVMRLHLLIKVFTSKYPVITNIIIYVKPTKKRKDQDILVCYIQTWIPPFIILKANDLLSHWILKGTPRHRCGSPTLKKH